MAVSANLRESPRNFARKSRAEKQQNPGSRKSLPPHRSPAAPAAAPAPAGFRTVYYYYYYYYYYYNYYYYYYYYYCCCYHYCYYY